jgi:hypothetical protein
MLLLRQLDVMQKINISQQEQISTLTELLHEKPDDPSIAALKDRIMHLEQENAALRMKLEDNMP